MASSYMFLRFSSCMFIDMNMHELSINKGVNPKFHAHKQYSHAPKLLLRVQEYELTKELLIAWILHEYGVI